MVAGCAFGRSAQNPAYRPTRPSLLAELAVQRVFPQVRGQFRCPVPTHPVVSCPGQYHRVCDIGVTLARAGGPRSGAPIRIAPGSRQGEDFVGDLTWRYGSIGSVDLVRLATAYAEGSSAGYLARRRGLHIQLGCPMRSSADEVITNARNGVPSRHVGDEPAELPGEVIRELVEGLHGGLLYRDIVLCGYNIDGDVDLSYSEWHGRIELCECRIAGNFDISHAILRGRICLDGSSVVELLAADATLDGALYLRNGFAASHGVTALGVKISGGLSLTGSFLTAPRADRTRSALGLYRAHLGDLFLNGACLDGGLYGIGLSVDRNLRLQGARVRSRLALGWETLTRGTVWP